MSDWFAAGKFHATGGLMPEGSAEILPECNYIDDFGPGSQASSRLRAFLRIEVFLQPNVIFSYAPILIGA
ncbi:MAG: hypothetical protein PHQ96_00630 [Candidatus Omnitrophica bacterium]|nr:hypothetical protein [Candidatus Omnitrophota bacterium]